jgi:hypothetical protein
MVAFDVVSLQDVITQRVRDAVPNTLVMEDTIPDDRDLPIVNGKLAPYIVLRYGPIRPSYTGKSMGGARLDEYWASCDILAISANGRVSRLLNAGIVDTLLGFRPDGIAPMHMRTDAGDPAQFVVSSNESRPTQFVATTRLRYTVNAGAPGVYQGDGFGSGGFGS